MPFAPYSPMANAASMVDQAAGTFMQNQQTMQRLKLQTLMEQHRYMLNQALNNARIQHMMQQNEASKAAQMLSQARVADLLMKGQVAQQSQARAGDVGQAGLLIPRLSVPGAANDYGAQVDTDMFLQAHKALPSAVSELTPEARIQLLQLVQRALAGEEAMGTPASAASLLSPHTAGSAQTGYETSDRLGNITAFLPGVTKPEKETMPYRISGNRRINEATGEVTDLPVQQKDQNVAPVLGDVLSFLKAVTTSSHENPEAVPYVPYLNAMLTNLAPVIAPSMTNVPPPSVQAPAQIAVPKVGEVRKGYRFKGGDPSKKENWEVVK